MKIEEALKQTKPFKSEFQKLMLNLAHTGSWFNNIMSEVLKPYELSHPQYNVLRILKGKHPDAYCNLEITQRMVDKSSNVTRIIDKLLEKKLVIRNENPENRRQVNICITNKGLAILHEIQSSADFEKLKSINFNEEKARLMNQWLDEIRDLV